MPKMSDFFEILKGFFGNAVSGMILSNGKLINSISCVSWLVFNLSSKIYDFQKGKRISKDLKRILNK